MLREAVDQVAPRRVALLLQAFHQARGETLFEQGEFAVEHRQRAFRALAVVEGEGHPQTCARSSRFRLSKNSMKPGTRSNLVSIT